MATPATAGTSDRSDLVLPGDTTITASICANETYPFNGELLQMSGEYTAVFTDSEGRDSTVTLFLTVLPLQTQTVTASICAGETYPFFGLALDSTGQYEAVLPGFNGCDSTVILNLTVLPHSTTNLSAGICSGTEYLFQGDILTESGTYLAVLVAANGCDSLVRLKLDVVDFFNTPLTAVICAGETYEFGGAVLNTSGVYTETLEAIGGCDSIITLTLTILPPLTTSLHAGICIGTSYEFNGETLTDSGVYTYTTSGANGCDSVVTLTLDVVPFFETAMEATICTGETFVFGTQELTTAGLYMDFLTAIGGCDSTVTLNLTVLPTTSGVDTVTICDGESFVYHGDTLSNPGDYEYVLDGYNGCDSVILFTLTVLDVPNTVLEAVVCHGKTFFFYGQTLTDSGVYEEVFNAANGCDSIVSLILTVLPELSSALGAAVCAGETYDFNGEILDASGVYTQILTSENDCDSTVTLTLTVFPKQETTLDKIICAGASYEFDDMLLTETGTYTAVFQDDNGCDSTVTLNLVVLAVQESQITASICAGSSYAFNGALLTDAGVYTSVLTGSYGCDSTVTLTLSVLPTQSSTLNVTICTGDAYDYFGQLLTESGSYEFSFTGANGCDSTVSVNVTVLPLQFNAIEAEICGGESYEYAGESLTATGSYQFAFPGFNGCDSIVIVYLTVHPSSNTILDVVACEGTSYDFNGATLVTSGSYIAEYTGFYGCDSTITLNLTFITLFESAVAATICSGESYVFGQDTLSENGDYTQTFSAAGGCDSVVVLTLTVLPVSQSVMNVSICAGESFPFNGALLTDAGMYTMLLSGANGCDSTAIINLSVLPAVTSTVEATICANDTYGFNGENLNESGEYTGVFSAQNGCDSTVTLLLTVLPTATGSIEATICSGDTYGFNGVVLNEAGTYTAIYSAANGCDSVVTLTLSVLPSSAGAFAAVVCNGETFTYNGEVLTTSGVYGFILDNASVNGCDSIVTLFLTIFPAIPPTTLDASICAGNTYPFNGQLLNETGQYTAELSSSTGCDSLVVLHLTVLEPSETFINLVVCEGQAGVFIDSLKNVAGCDSIVVTTVVVEGLEVSVTLDNNVLTASTSENVEFQWINCANNQPINGANGNSFTPASSGQYAVLVTNASGCTALSGCVTVALVAVHEPATAQDWKLQPNPAQNHTSVVLTEALLSDVRLEILDAAGRLLHQQTVTAGSVQVELNLTDFPDGILLVRLMGSEGTSSKLLMKGN